MSNTGRKPIIETPEEMQVLINKYFESCDGRPLLDGEGHPIVDKHGSMILIGQHPPTVSGLALALGFHSRQSLLNYQGKEEFLDTITRAKLRIEDYCEQRLFDRDGQRGAEFNLRCNFRWKQEEKSDGDDEEEGSGVVMLAPVMENPGPPVPAEGGASDG